jgi:hypothetical protein
MWLFRKVGLFIEVLIGESSHEVGHTVKPSAGEHANGPGTLVYAFSFLGWVWEMASLVGALVVEGRRPGRMSGFGLVEGYAKRRHVMISAENVELKYSQNIQGTCNNNERRLIDGLGSSLGLICRKHLGPMFYSAEEVAAWHKLGDS